MDEDGEPPVQFTLHRPRGVRLDILPFGIGYAMGFGAYMTVPSLEFAANVGTPILVAAHLVTFLVCHWSLSVRCALQLKRVVRATDATLARARSGNGRSELCPLQCRSTDAHGKVEVRFEFRKRTYILEASSSASQGSANDADRFRELSMPYDRPLSEYCNGRGLRGEQLTAAAEKFGDNSFAIPGRSFGELFVEHALAPFFVFQVFCVLLWSLDDYWYYSLFTLVRTP
jgi:cation-transporting ATPase 13A1